MKLIIYLIVTIMVTSTVAWAQAPSQTSSQTGDMIFRISEIEVHPQYLDEYLEAAHEVGATSVREEAGVVCIFPMQVKRDKHQVRILEIYASQEAYKEHIASAHFQKYKQGTLHMVKTLDLVDCDAMAPETLPLIFRKPASSGGIFPTVDRASAEHNTGEVFLSLLKDSGNTMICHFLFTPGSRNFWHYHPDAEQTLLVLDGEGFYQEEGGKRRTIRKGDVIVTGPDIRHWNGATADSYIYCMTVTEHAIEDHTVQLRAVTDAEYQRN